MKFWFLVLFSFMIVTPAMACERPVDEWINLMHSLNPDASIFAVRENRVEQFIFNFNETPPKSDIEIDNLVVFTKGLAYPVMVGFVLQGCVTDVIVFQFDEFLKLLNSPIGIDS